MRFNRTTLMMLAACSLLLPASVATAQQSSKEGIVKLSHFAKVRKVRRPIRIAADRCDGCGHGARGYYHGHGPCRHGRTAGICGGRLGYGGNPHYSHCCLGHFLNEHSPYHTCTYSPDYGFAPPAQRPIWPTSAAYCRMYPSKWTGEQLPIDPHFRHPMVYMPTDTTQLGYYYQHTPYWRARRGMIPPVPHPAEWHTPDHGVVFTGYKESAHHALQGCPPEIIDHGVGTPIDGSIGQYLEQGAPADGASGPMIESDLQQLPYSNEPVNPQMVPPAEEAAPAPPGAAPPVPSETTPPAAPAGADLEKSASLPLLIPVPPK